MINVKLWVPGKSDLPAEVEQAATAACEEVRKRIAGLPGWEPEIYVGSAELARGGKLVVVFLPMRAQAHREVMGLLVSPATQAQAPDRIYSECLWYVHGQPEPGQVAARKFLSDLATNVGGSLASARFNMALAYVNGLASDEGKD